MSRVPARVVSGLSGTNKRCSPRINQLLQKSTYVRMGNDPEGETAHVLKELQINALQPRQRPGCLGKLQRAYLGVNDLTHEEVVFSSFFRTPHLIELGITVICPDACVESLCI